MYRLVVLALAATVGLCLADVNDDLFAAARKGDLDTIKALVGKGASVEAKTSYGQTPLYLAAMSGHLAVVQYLLDKGAKTDVNDTFYKASLLDFVLERKHYDIAKLIIAKGDCKIDDELKEVADAGQVDLVDAVIARGKPSQKALDSAYEQALTEKKTEVAASLKKAGANEPAPAFQVDAKVLDSYTGTYKTEQLPFDITVFIKEGALNLQATGQPSFAPKPKSATQFVFPQYGLEVEFDTPSSFTLKQGGGTFKFKKVVTQ